MLIYLLVLIVSNSPAAFVVADEYRTETACHEARTAFITKAAKKEDSTISGANVKCMAVYIEKGVI